MSGGLCVFFVSEHYLRQQGIHRLAGRILAESFGKQFNRFCFTTLLQECNDRLNALGGGSRCRIGIHRRFL